MDPGTGEPPPPDKKEGELSSLFIRMLMVVADEDKDGKVPPKEIQPLKDKIFEKVDAGGDKKKPTTPEKK